MIGITVKMSSIPMATMAMRSFPKDHYTRVKTTIFLLIDLSGVVYFTALLNRGRANTYPLFCVHLALFERGRERQLDEIIRYIDTLAAGGQPSWRATLMIGAIA